MMLALLLAMLAALCHVASFRMMMQGPAATPAADGDTMHPGRNLLVSV
jgi:hypothetical protein